MTPEGLCRRLQRSVKTGYTLQRPFENPTVRIELLKKNRAKNRTIINAQRKCKNEPVQAWHDIRDVFRLLYRNGLAGGQFGYEAMGQR